MTHLTRDELERWWKEGARAERDRILSHLAECDDCGALYEEVIDAEPAQPDTAPAFADFARRGYRAYRRPRRGLGYKWSSPRVLAVCGAAAVIMLAVIIPALRESPPRIAPTNSQIRGAALQPLSPIGTVDSPVRFRWASPVDAARYIVEVRNEQGELLFVVSSDMESVDLSRDQMTRLTPGRTYSWAVVAMGSGGEEIMRAPTRSFVVSLGRR